MLTIFAAIQTAMNDLKRTDKLPINTSSPAFEAFLRTMGAHDYQALEKKYTE